MGNNLVTLLLTALLQHKFTFLFLFQTFFKLTIRSFTINTIQFTVSNNRTLWTFDFSPDLNEKNLTIRSLEIPLAACILLLSQRQEFLYNHLPRVPLTPNQHGTVELREEILSIAGAQDTDTRGYELSDLEDIEFSWKNPAVDMDSAYRPGIDTPFSPSIFDDFQMGSTAANQKRIDDEGDKENSAPTTTTTPESESPTTRPRLLRSRPFGTQLESLSDPVYRTQT